MLGLVVWGSSVCLRERLGFFDWETFVNHVVSSTFVFFKVSARTGLHLKGLERSDWHTESINVVINVDFTSNHFVKAWLVKLILSFSLRNGVEVPRHLVGSRTWLLVLFLVFLIFFAPNASSEASLVWSLLRTRGGEQRMKWAAIPFP